MTPDGMIPKSEILTAISSAGFDPDISAAIQNWLTEQPGAAVPQEAFMLYLAELAEVENHMASSVAEMADEVQTLATESQRLDDQNLVAELQLQRDGLAQMEQYATMAENLVPETTPQPPTPSTNQAPSNVTA